MALKDSKASQKKLCWRFTFWNYRIWSCALKLKLKSLLHKSLFVCDFQLWSQRCATTTEATRWQCGWTSSPSCTTPGTTMSACVITTSTRGNLITMQVGVGGRAGGVVTRWWCACRGLWPVSDGRMMGDVPTRRTVNSVIIAMRTRNWNI